ncbi:MAG: HD domain-containing protein, partial [Actinobacteria bacterium]|nr:HD domain-containing protein [Actinomycetota bacterium]
MNDPTRVPGGYLLHSETARRAAARLAVFHCAVMGVVVAIVAAHYDQFDTFTVTALILLAIWSPIMATLPWHRKPHNWLAKVYFLGASWFVMFAIHFDNPYLLVGLFPEMMAFADIYWYRRSALVVHQGLLIAAFIGAAAVIGGEAATALTLIALPLMISGGLVAGSISHRFIHSLLERQQFQSAVRSLLEALHARDGYTGDHSKETLAMTMAVAHELELEADVREQLADTALLHDIGKIGIPNSILQKPGKLTDDEWVTMKRHPEIGEQILRDMPGFEEVANAVRHEHERWDGGGYPDGVAGEQIPLISRIVLACDAYHAMTSDRPYRAAMSEDEALAELRRNSGTQFDPRVVVALENAIVEGRLERHIDDVESPLGELQEENDFGREHGEAQAPLRLDTSPHAGNGRSTLNDPRLITTGSAISAGLVALATSAYLVTGPGFDRFGALLVAGAATIAFASLAMRRQGAPRWWNFGVGLLAYAVAPMAALHFDEPAMLVLALGASVMMAAFFSERLVVMAFQSLLQIGGYVVLPVALFGWELLPFSAASARAFPGTLSAIGYFIKKLLAMRFERDRFTATMSSLLLALEARDGYTSEHSDATLEMAMLVADELKLDETVRLELKDVALLHDIGKIGIPDEILNKPGKLTDDEWAVMRTHPIVGQQIVSRVPGFESVADAIRHEHERWDGNGYPDRIAGTRIPLASRIVLACDAYHA